MKQTWNLVKREAKLLTREVQEEDLVMSWLLLLMLPPVLLWETLRRLLNPIVRMLTDRTHYLALISIRISIWMLSLKIKLRKTRVWITTKFGHR